jgi:tetratricopeptide (TPR) repeat protein
MMDFQNNISQATNARFKRSEWKMYTWVGLVVFFCLSTALQGQETANKTAKAQSTIKEVSFTTTHKSLFVGQLAVATIRFDSIIQEPSPDDLSGSFWQVLNYEIIQHNPLKTQSSSLVIHFIPKYAGIITIPPIEFRSESSHYRSRPKQLTISKPIQSRDMDLMIQPKKTQIYVGEPLQVDLTWETNLEANKLAMLQLNPEFINNPDIEVIIPRHTGSEKSQVGIPIGGRRVIATRTFIEEDKGKALGSVHIPLFLRFTKPGLYRLPATRLECAFLTHTQRDFALYGAHYNNSLFEPVDPEEYYKRIFTTSEPITIEVLPLPTLANERPFSGLFTPINVDINVSPKRFQIGSLINLSIKISGQAPHGMFELPSLNRFKELHEGFIIDDDYKRLWHADGTVFQTNMRIISTSIKAFPSLSMNLFDTGSGNYTLYKTEPILLEPQPFEGKTFLPRNIFDGATISLTPQLEGIWNNQQGNAMNDFINMWLHLSEQFFWYLLLIAPILFILLLPIAKEYRRRSLDKNYRKCVELYAQLRKSHLNLIEKWIIFQRFLAICAGHNEASWTRKNTQDMLKKSHITDDEMTQVLEMHATTDAKAFSSKPQVRDYKGIDKTLLRIAKKMMRSTFLWMTLALFLPDTVFADEWSEAQALFVQASSQIANNQTAQALYEQSALKFEASAKAGKHRAEAWLNSGNAWFEAGKIGRALAAYRHAQAYQPFNRQLRENIQAAQALRLNQPASALQGIDIIPTAYFKAVLVSVNLFFWIALFLYIRYRKRRWTILTIIATNLLLITALALILKIATNDTKGVIVVDLIMGRKGPNYSYATAFQEPLHDGLEFTLIERRDRWLYIKISETQVCWIPQGQAVLIEL